jgi:predicted alpha/beta hydrolase family esterase
MATDVLFIHSAGPQSGGQGSSPLVRSLRRGLGGGYRVHCPTMPRPDDPSGERWLAELARRIPEDRVPRILVGHSLGGSVLLKHLTERERTAWPAGLFLVATPWWGIQDWDTREFELRDGFARFLPDTLPVHLYRSRDDEVVPLDHLSRYAAALPQAVVHPLDGGGHTFPEGLPELVRDIRAVDGARR